MATFLETSSNIWLGGLGLAFLISIKILQKVYYLSTSPLSVLPGPKRENWLLGNLPEVWADTTLSTADNWHEQHGPTIAVHSVLGNRVLSTIDTKALNHIMTHPDVYHKTRGAKHNLAAIFGEGLLAVEGEKHRIQRRVMNPAFGPAQIRAFTDLFVDKANILRDVLLEAVENSNGKSVDILPHINKATMDIIGLAGFHYNFNALTSNAQSNALNKSFSELYNGTMWRNILTIARGRFPLLRYIRTDADAKEDAARISMREIGQQLVNESRSLILAETSSSESDLKAKDLLSLLMKANVAQNLPPDLRMSEEDVLCQVPTFMIAGHETVATSTIWAIYALTQAPEVQFKLRQELLSVPTDTPTMDVLNSLPYLDAVLREVLRLHAAVPSSARTSMQDDLLPLNTPIIDRNGNVRKSILLKKGTTIRIPILAINRTETLWGPDAKVFKPERWLDSTIPRETNSIPGVWSHLMTFLGGSRACIGYRFSLVEMKSLLFVLVRSFEFQLAVPSSEIIKTALIVQRPQVKSDRKKGNQLPLIIKPI